MGSEVIVSGTVKKGAPRGRAGVPPGNPCLVPACGNAGHTRGYCNGHYLRMRTHGTPGATQIRRKASRGTGGRWVDNHGYVILTVGLRRISEHRLVMEKMIGRELRSDESVHHKNGVRSDNRPSNLELWSKYQPSGQRVEDLVLWAQEILARYGNPSQVAK